MINYYDDDDRDPNSFYPTEEWYDEGQADADWCQEQRESAGEDV